MECTRTSKGSRSRKMRSPSRRRAYCSVFRKDGTSFPAMKHQVIKSERCSYCYKGPAQPSRFTLKRSSREFLFDLDLVRRLFVAVQKGVVVVHVNLGRRVTWTLLLVVSGICRESYPSSHPARHLLHLLPSRYNRPGARTRLIRLRIP